MDAELAKSALGEVVSAVGRWREIAALHGVTSTERTRFQAVLDGGHEALGEAMSRLQNR